MLKYNITVWIDGYAQIILPVEYETEYNLKQDIIRLGINGVMQKKENNYEYYPPHKIQKIEIEEVKI